jgi:hypothetical protein
MTSRSRRVGVILLAALTVTAGCADTDNNDGNATVASTTADTAAPAAVTDASSATVDVAGADPPTDSDTAAGAASSPPSSAPRVEVTGGQLPTQLLDGYATNGGDLVTDEEWAGRYGPSGLPILTGPGVTLAEAVQRVERRDGGWVRTDEASWLAMSSDDRDAVLAAMAAAAGVEGTPTRTGSTEQAADCVIDRYPAADGVEWTIQGCSYERFSRMIAVGVSRTASTDVAAVGLDPTVGAIVDELAGAVTFSEVRFGAPGADGSTLHLATQVSTDVDVDTAATAVTTGPLAGWQTFPGEGSLLLSGPTGGTWTLSDRVAVYAWAGRW